MVEIIAKIGRKNQVTLPAEVRRHLRLKPLDRVAFVLHDDGQVELRSAPLDLESIIGSIPALPGESLDLEREIEEATAEEIERLARRRSLERF